MKTPDEIYTCSQRKYKGDYEEIDYPIGYLTRKVAATGEIILNSVRISVGKALRGLQVGLRPTDEPNVYDLFLTDFLLGSLDMNACCFYPLDNLKSK